MRNFVLIVIMGFLFNACFEEEAYRPPVFFNEQKIEGVCLSEELLISYAYGMCVDDNYIYVLALADNKWVQVYDKKTGKHLGAFVGRGQGPGEVSVGESITLNEENTRLSVYDQAQQRLVTYRLSKVDNMPILSFEEGISFVSFKAAVRNVWPLGKSLLINGQLGEQNGFPKRFQLLKHEELVAEYNKFPMEERGQQLTFLSPQVCFSPSFKKMATGTLYGGVLELFHLDDSNISLYGIKKFYEPKVNVGDGNINPESGMQYGFSAMCATKDLIYTVLIGNEDPNKLNSISVFDWEGKSLMKYHTDQLIFKLACSKDDDKRLYALTFEPSKGFSMYVYGIGIWNE